MTSFREKLEVLGKGDKLTAAALKFLSDVPIEDRNTLREVWPTFSLQRRTRIIGSLAAIIEDNIDFDFRRVFLNALEDSDPEIRIKAIEGLVEDHSTLFLGRLLTMLRNDLDKDVRESAATALGKFTYLAELNKLSKLVEDTRLRDALVQSARDRAENEDVRRRAVESLGYYNGNKEVQELIAEQYKQGNKHGESAVLAMGRTMDREWSPIILHELKSTRPAMRYEAAHAAGEMTLTEALPLLVVMTEDTDLEVSLSTIWALGQIGGKPAADALALAAKSDNPAIREAAQDAIQEIAFSANPLIGDRGAALPALIGAAEAEAAANKPRRIGPVPRKAN
ncbi:MAG: HEAT repeat domain-containing protein [Chloroflexia bacterium]